MSEKTNLPHTMAVLEEGMQKGLHVGAQLYVSLAGDIVADAGIGIARPGVPMTRDTLMLWLSSSKPVGAIAIGQLYDKGLLEWDDPVVRHIPEFGANGKEAVTIRHLLTHTGGFRNADTIWNDLSFAENFEMVCEAPLEPDWVPGEKAGYHISSSWYVLGELVQRLDGRPFEVYAREEIFLPLGMADSWMGMTPEVYRGYGDRIGIMHDTGRGEPRVHPFWDTERGCELVRPGANGHGPIHELAGIYEGLLQMRKGDIGGLLRPETARDLTFRHRAGMMDLTFKAPVDWGLGFLLQTPDAGGASLGYGYGQYSSRDTFGHSGSQSSTAYADPAHDLVVGWVCNGTPGPTAHHKRAQAVNEAIYGDLGLAERS